MNANQKSNIVSYITNNTSFNDIKEVYNELANRYSIVVYTGTDAIDLIELNGIMAVVKLYSLRCVIESNLDTINIILI